MAPYGIDVQHPDTFLCNHFNLAPGVFLTAVRKVRGRLKNPPYTAKEYLAILTRQGLAATAAELEQYSELIHNMTSSKAGKARLLAARPAPLPAESLR